jgi:hypothetical protein
MDDGAAPEDGTTDASDAAAVPAPDTEPVADGDVLVGDVEEVIERAVLNDSEEGREIAAGFVKLFADYFATSVRPILVQVAEEGRHPQLLVNGLAELMRTTADRIEFPLDHPRAGTPK